MIKSFVDRDGKDRLAALKDLDAIQATCSGYFGDCIAVAVPRGGTQAVEQWAKKHGLKLRNMYYFPLGTDKPAMHMRHDSSMYGGTFCNWLIANYAPFEEVQS